MRKKIIALIIVSLLAGCAKYIHKVFVPSQIESYCKRITVTTRSMKTCIQNELDAKEQLSRMDIPDDVDRKCRRLSESTGGSYQVMLVCVQQELSKI